MTEQDILTKGRELAESYNRDGEGFKNTGRKNAYECDGERSFTKGKPDKPGCGSFIVTIDRDPGVTPFMVRCGNCGMMAHSKGYKVQDWLVPTHEWYRPETLDGIPEHSHEHLSRGGLILRPIDGAPWQSRSSIAKAEIESQKQELKRLQDMLEKNSAAFHEAEREMRKGPFLSRQQLRTGENDE